MTDRSEVEWVSALLDLCPQRLALAARRLSEAERARASRLRLEREHRRFVAARARLRELLAERLDEAPEAIAFAYGENGKPALAGPSARSGWRFNVSHCDELALYAFSRRCELGVDVEAVRELPEADAIAAQAFSPREHEAYRALQGSERPLGFLRCWTRKEALVKGLGTGLAVPPEKLDVLSPPPGWRLESFVPAPGFIAALAWR